MTFEQSTDEQNTDVIIERSIFWGFWKQKISFEGKHSVFEKILEKFKWRK